MTKIYKEFPGPSVDNPVLLCQFAQTLAKRYAEMFPASRGFALELKEQARGKIRGWEITILRGFLSGAEVVISPDRFVPQQISIRVRDNSQLQETLTKFSAALALVITAPIFFLGIFKMRLGFVLIACLVVLFVLILVLSLIMMLICRLLKPLDHYFGELTKSRILDVANQLALPTAIDRSDVPPPPPPHPSAAPIPAFPTRRGPFGIGR